MNILWVSPFLPKTDATHAGGRALAQWIGWTAERHRVTLLCRVEPGEREDAGRLAPHLAGLHLQEFGRPSGPGATARIAASYARLGRAASQLLRAGGFDLLHVEYLESGLAIDRACAVPKLVVAIDELARPALHRLRLARGAGPRLSAWLYWRAIGRLQSRICRKFDRILTMSEHDRRTLLARDPALSVGVLPLPGGLDLARARACAGRAEVLFVGAMYRDANVDAVRWFHGRSCRGCASRSGRPLHDRRCSAARRDPAAGRVARDRGHRFRRIARAALRARDCVRGAAADRWRHRGQDARRAGRRLSRRDDHHRQ
jgi:hypothetical protein